MLDYDDDGDDDGDDDDEDDSDDDDDECLLILWLHALTRDRRPL